MFLFLLFLRVVIAIEEPREGTITEGINAEQATKSVDVSQANVENIDGDERTRVKGTEPVEEPNRD